MFSGGQSSENVSLLPDNPGVRIEAVQGGGGISKEMSWLSEPVEIDPASKFKLMTNLGTLKKYQTRWRQTLGPSIPSRRKPRQDPHIIIGSLSIFDCPTYIAAPLRGDQDAASMVFGWADEILEVNPESHIVFMGPLMGKQSNKFIENGLTSLLSKYPGHVVFVSENETTLPSLNGLLLNGVPETSKQIALGFIPDHENVYHRSTRDLDCLRVDTLRVPFSKASEEEDSDSLFYLNFNVPTRVEAREKDFEHKVVSGTMIFKTTPGWVTKISFLGYQSSIDQEGGDTTIKPGGDATSGEVEVALGNSRKFKIRKNARAAWEKGDFTAEELALLQSEGLQYSNPVYAKFFEGLISNKCTTEPETQLSPDCGIFRYIMADRYYREVKAMKEGKKTMKVGDGTVVDSSTNITKSPEDVEPPGAGPDAPAAPAAPGTSSSPGAPAAPGTSSSPGAPAVPGAPGTSSTPGAPAAPLIPAKPITGKLTDRVTDANVAAYIERVVAEAEKAKGKKWFGKDLDKALKDVLALRNAELEKANETYKTTDIAAKTCERKLYDGAITFFTNYDRFKQIGEQVQTFLVAQLEKVTAAKDNENTVRYRTMIRIIQRDLNIKRKIDTFISEDEKIRKIVTPVITTLKTIQVSLFTAIYGPIAIAHDALKFSTATEIIAVSGGFKGAKFVKENPLRVLGGIGAVAAAPVVITAVALEASMLALVDIGKKLAEVELLVNQAESWNRLAENSVNLDIINSYKEMTSVYNVLMIVKSSLSKTENTADGAKMTTLKSDIDKAIEKTKAMKLKLQGYSNKLSKTMSAMIEKGEDYFSEMFNNFAQSTGINNLETIKTFKTKRSEMISSLNTLAQEKITYMRCFIQNMNLRAIQVYKVAELEVKFKKAELEYNKNVSEVISDALIKSGTDEDEYTGIHSDANKHIGKQLGGASIEKDAFTEVKRHIVDITNELHEIEDKFSHIQEIKFIIQNGTDTIDEQDSSSFSNKIVKNVLCKAFADVKTSLTHKSTELMEVTDTDTGEYLQYMLSVNNKSIFIDNIIKRCTAPPPMGGSLELNYKYYDITPQLCKVDKNAGAKIVNDKIKAEFNPDFNIEKYFKFNPSLVKLNDDTLLMSYRIYFGKIRGCKDFDLKKCHYWDNGWQSELWDNKSELSLNYTGISKIDPKTFNVTEDILLIQPDKPSGIEDVRLFEYNDIIYESGISITGFNKYVREANIARGKKDSKGMVSRELIETYGKKSDIITKLPGSSLEVEYNCKTLHESSVEKNWFGYTNKKGEHIMINPSFGTFFPLKQRIIDFTHKHPISNDKFTDGSVNDFKNIPEFECKEYPDITGNNLIDMINKPYLPLLVSPLKKNSVFIRLSGGSWGIPYTGDEILFIGHIVVDLTILDAEKVKLYIKNNPKSQLTLNLSNLLTKRPLAHPSRFIYLQVFYTIDQVKNEIRQISHGFNVFENKERDTGINFPVGLVNIGDEYLVSFGESDYKSVIISLNKGDLEKLFNYSDAAVKKGGGELDNFKILTYTKPGGPIDYGLPDKVNEVITGVSGSGSGSGSAPGSAPGSGIVIGGTRRKNRRTKKTMKIRFIY